MPWSKQLFLSLHDLRLHGELLAGQAERLLGEGLGHAGELEHHAPRLDHAHPALGRALAGAHAGLGRLLREALVGEDVDPDLAAALDLARHRDTSRLDLAVRDPAGVQGLEPVVAELDGGLAAGVASATAAMHLAELGLLRHQHRLPAVLLRRALAAALRLLLRGIARLLELRRILHLLLRRRRVRRLGDLLRRDFHLRLDHRLLAALRRHRVLVGARLLDIVLATGAVPSTRTGRRRPCARTGATSPAASRTAGPAALAAPPLPYRTEALAVGTAAAPALAGGAETLERAAAATPRVLVAQARIAGVEALRHDLALVDPDLDADPARGRLRLDEAVVDVRADRVQRDASLAVHLAPAHLAAAEAARALDLHAGGSGADRGGERALHRAPEGHAVRELLGDRLRDELRIELRPLDLVDVDVDVLLRQRMQVAPQGVDLDPGLPDHDPGPRGVDVDRDPLLVLANEDVGQPRVRELVVDVLADPDVLEDVARELLLAGVPVGLPVVDDAHAEPARMNFLAHYSSLSSAVSGSSESSGVSTVASGASAPGSSAASGSSTVSSVSSTVSGSSTASGSSTGSGSGAAIAGTDAMLETDTPC